MNQNKHCKTFLENVLAVGSDLGHMDAEVLSVEVSGAKWTAIDAYPFGEGL